MTATATRTVHPVIGDPDTYVTLDEAANLVTLHISDLPVVATLAPAGVIDLRSLANAAVAFARAWDISGEDLAHYGGDAEYARYVSLNSLLGRCADGCCGVGADIAEPTPDPAEDDPRDGIDWPVRTRAIHHVARCVRTARWGD